MKTAGIICEYNPFHLGHAKQLRIIRQTLGDETAIVCVMSGNYVQRGVPATWDKFTRARAAVSCGADLVLELPLTHVLQSAEGFARGGVEILSRLHVDYLSFGAECGNGSLLMQMAEKMEQPAYQQKLRDALNQGLSYAAARQHALEDPDQILSKPNNILGLEYCRAILTCGSNLQPFVITRGGDYHAETADQVNPSATAVRALYPDGSWQSYVPVEAISYFTNVPWYDLSFGERAVLARLRALSEEEWKNCAHGSEGLWCKAMKAVRTQPDLEAIIQAVKSKRYPRTRIQRLLLSAYLGITQKDLQVPIPYSRILAVSETGRQLIRTARSTCDLPLINPGQAPENVNFYKLETRSSDLFTLFSAPSFPFPSYSEQSARLF